MHSTAPDSDLLTAYILFCHTSANQTKETTSLCRNIREKDHEGHDNLPGAEAQSLSARSRLRVRKLETELERKFQDRAWSSRHGAVPVEFTIINANNF